jgi:hypothetical protein
MAALGTLRIASGTFAGATTGSTVTGKGISYRLDGTFVATVVVEFQDNAHDDWIACRSDTAAIAATSMPVQINDNAIRNWRVRCSAYTSGSPKYSIQAIPHTFIKNPGDWHA